jgi:hypothetical protein
MREQELRIAYAGLILLACQLYGQTVITEEDRKAIAVSVENYCRLTGQKCLSNGRPELKLLSA